MRSFFLFFVLHLSRYTVHAQTPGAVWSTYVGGNGYDGVSASTVNAAGNIYVAGTTTSSNLAFGANVHDVGMTHKLDLPKLVKGIYKVVKEGEEMRGHIKLILGQ